MVLDCSTSLVLAVPRLVHEAWVPLKVIPTHAALIINIHDHHRHRHYHHHNY